MMLTMRSRANSLLWFTLAFSWYPSVNGKFERIPKNEPTLTTPSPTPKNEPTLTTPSPTVSPPTTLAPVSPPPTTQAPTAPLPTTPAPTTPPPTTPAPTVPPPTIPAPIASSSPATPAPVASPPATPATQAPVAPSYSSSTSYVTKETSTELVTLPEPPAVNLALSKSDCPHMDTGLRRWNDPTTWGSGSVPAGGHDVTLPFASRILVDEPVLQVLGVVTIPIGTELIFGENVNGVEMHATGFHVFGKLTAGSESCRIETPVLITLHGQRPADAVTNVPPATFKGIAVEGGIISLHGKRYFRTWSRLAKTIEPGDTSFYLQDTVNWEPGQEVVLVTSSLKDSRDYNRNEVRIIQSVIANPEPNVGAKIVLTEAATFRHVANNYYQVEVGLLTRTIKVQGAEDSEPVDPDPLDGSCKDVDAWNSDNVYYQTTAPCMNKELTGYGGHILVEEGGKGQIEGVELYRMGQTNVRRRYPIHFHLIGNCPTCYVKDSSIHRSFWRCVTVHGTNQLTVTENVAFNAVGHCIYLEDGVEEDNTFSFNLVAHIHTLGHEMPRGFGNRMKWYQESDTLAFPGDVTAAGFYISNVHNNFIGNSASGGYAGYAFPNLMAPLQFFRNEAYRPLNVEGLVFDGNVAHSTGWWWHHAGAFYFGGGLQYWTDEYGVEKLIYNPGRFTSDARDPCKINTCTSPFQCGFCPTNQEAWIKITNTKVFLTAGIGMNSWRGRLEVVDYEAHDVRLAAQSNGYFLDNILTVCRTGEKLDLPSNNANAMRANGFLWYDTGQESILTRATFRNCGYRSDYDNEYDTSVDRGCGDDPETGCHPDSSVFEFDTFSDEVAAEIIQGTRDVSFDKCGRRFRFSEESHDSVSGRLHSWLDVDGTISGFRETTLIGSALPSVSDWWKADDNSVYEPQCPLWFNHKSGGPERALGYAHMEWDAAMQNPVSTTICTNGGGEPCPIVGYIRHVGPRFNPSTTGTRGRPLTPSGHLNGLTGGFGWILDLNKPAPRSIDFTKLQIEPGSPLLISIPYPIGTTFQITANAPSYCWVTSDYTCVETFTQVGSIDEVRFGRGNTYHIDADGVVTFRIGMLARKYVGNPDFSLPDYTSPARWGDDVWALRRVDKGGVLLPMASDPYYHLQANCQTSDGVYCSGNVKANYDRDVCQAGYVQTGYDKCCKTSNPMDCIFANGS